MSTAPNSTSEMANTTVFEKNQEEINSDSLDAEKKAVISSNIDLILELLGCIFVLIIISIICCEIFLFSLVQLMVLSQDATLYRYLILVFLALTFLYIILLNLLMMFISMLFASAIKSIVQIGLIYFYDTEKETYRWWQTRSFITLIMVCITTIITTIILIELGHLIFLDLIDTNFYAGRFVLCRMFGLVTLVLCAMMTIVKMLSFFYDYDPIRGVLYLIANCARIF